MVLVGARRWSGLVLLVAGAPKTGTSIPTGTNDVPWYFAFDAGGNLWISESAIKQAGVDKVVEYLASSLSAGTPKVGATITGPQSGATAQPMAFDAKGNLWIGNFPTMGTVQEFVAASLATSAPKKGTTLSGMPLEGSLAFDADGNLWTVKIVPSNHASDAVVEYTAASLASGTPVVATSFGAADAQGVAFDPPPYPLPLSH